MNIYELSPRVRNVLLNVHQKHLSAMGMSKKEKHSLDNIKKVVVCKDHLKVYYKHGDWYHYHVNGTWY